ncbi:MAG: sigma-70 family RNA polymerase sigma factor, partial [Eubacterium sp.]
SIKKPKAFISYLNAVTYTICIREKRKITERNAMISLDILTDYPDGDSKAFPENRFINGETAKELTNALSHLPEKYTQAFLLRHLEKVPLKKIAALLDCSVSSVKRYLKTAEFELHNHLEGKGFRIILWGPFLSGAFSNTADAPAKGSFINSCSSLIKKSSFSMACKTVAVIFALTCVGGGAYSIATTKPAMADTPSNVTTTPTAITQASVDTNPPIITGYNSADSNIVIYAQDDASGIDYNTVVATSVSGKSITPLSIDPQTGSMTFESP